jgi:AMP phosphorylase
MRLKVKNLPIGTGDIVIAVLCEKDATRMDIQSEDRILLTADSKKIVATADIIGRINGARKGHKEKMLMPGEIGLFLEAQYALGVKTGDYITISSAQKPLSLQYIKKKLEGKRLSSKELHVIIKDIINKDISDMELAYFVAASYLNKMDMNEITALTEAMVHSGDILKLPQKIIVDKHCIGGVAANRTSALIVPILAAAGLTIPKTSSRSITSAAGTADTMEVLCPVVFSLDDMKKVVTKTHGCLVWGGAMSLAPADDKIIQVEHPLSIDPEGQLLASIMAKKKSVCASHVLIDIPVGKGAKITEVKEAHALKRKFETLAKRLHMKIAVIITDGSQPIGNGIGPSLEARDILWTLKNSAKGSILLKNKSIVMAGVLLELTGKAKKGKGEEMAREIVETGKAYQKFIEIIQAQGGKLKKPEQIRLAHKSKDILATRSGVLTHIDNGTMNKIARIAGAPHDKEAGIYLYYHKGAKVKRGDKLFTVYSDSQERLDFALETIRKIDGVEVR